MASSEAHVVDPTSGGQTPLRPHETIGYALKQAQHAMRTRMDRELKALGLSAPQYSVLASLESETGASNAMLARRAFVTPQTMQGMIAKLERAGLIDRTPDAEHGRIQRTELTEAGRRTVKQAHEIAARSEAIVAEAVAPHDPNEVAAMLTRCAEQLR